MLLSSTRLRTKQVDSECSECFVDVQAGDIQLWGLESQSLLDSIPCADPAVSSALIPDSPYICIGCKSGMLQFLQMNKATGEPAEGVSEVHSLELLPYECELWT